MTLSTAHTSLKVDDLHRTDYDQYLKQLAKFTKDDMRECFADWRLYRRAFIWVLEFDGTRFVPVRFHPRSWQHAYEGNGTQHESLSQLKRTSFDIALKSRKTGFTTDLQTECYAKAATNSNFKAMFLSFEEQAAKDTASILQTAHDYNPVKTELAKNNLDGMEWKKTKSSIAIRTAGARVLGRGLNLSLLHMTEVSHFYKSVSDAPNFMAGVLEAVARGGRVVLESTPNGEDAIFYQTWGQAKNGELWNPIFLSVFMDDTVNWQADHPEALPSTRNESFDLSPYEMGLMEQMHAGRGHIRFLRYQKQKMNAKSPSSPSADWLIGDESLLLQEFPVDDISAFLSSAETVFEPRAVQQHRTRAKPPLWVEQSGDLKIWERPIVGRPYVVFADVSEGGLKSDWQAAAVLDPEKLKYVAVLRCRRQYPEFAKALYDLSVQYNEALLMVERNNEGSTVLHILDAQMGYPNLYHHDESGFTKVYKLGWRTDRETKPIMVRTFKEAFEAGALEINDSETLYEMGQYRLVPQSVARGQDKYQAPSGGHDDLVIAHMGAYQGREIAYVTMTSKPVHYGGLGDG